MHQKNLFVAIELDLLFDVSGELCREDARWHAVLGILEWIQDLLVDMFHHFTDL